MFVGLETLIIGVRDAVLSFNDGAISRIHVLENLDVGCGMNMRMALVKIDKKRVERAEIASQQMTKEARTLKRSKKRKVDEEEAADHGEYGPGMF